MELIQNNFVEQLKVTLEMKCKKNPSYSLRSFAKSLGINSGSLSRVMSGQRKPTLKMIEKVGPALGLNATQILDCQKIALREELDHSQQKFNQLSQDMFAIIADWYHLSLLELMKLDDFQTDPKWISQRLELNVHQVKSAIDRLVRVGILQITDKGVWVDKTDGYTTHYDKTKTTEARKSYQLQLLEKSKESIVKDDYSIRDHSGMTMAIDPKDISIAKDMIVNFRKNLSKKLESTKSKKEVYQLQVSLFPITKNRKGKN